MKKKSFAVLALGAVLGLSSCIVPPPPPLPHHHWHDGPSYNHCEVGWRHGWGGPRLPGPRCY